MQKTVSLKSEQSNKAKIVFSFSQNNIKKFWAASIPRTDDALPTVVLKRLELNELVASLIERFLLPPSRLEVQSWH